MLSERSLPFLMSHKTFVRVQKMLFLSKKSNLLRIITTQPILVLLGAHSLSVATLVAVSDEVDIWVALRFSYH